MVYGLSRGERAFEVGIEEVAAQREPLAGGVGLLEAGEQGLEMVIAVRPVLHGEVLELELPGGQCSLQGIGLKCNAAVQGGLAECPGEAEFGRREAGEVGAEAQGGRPVERSAKGKLGIEAEGGVGAVELAGGLSVGIVGTEQEALVAVVPLLELVYVELAVAPAHPC